MRRRRRARLLRRRAARKCGLIAIFGPDLAQAEPQGADTDLPLTSRERHAQARAGADALLSLNGESSISQDLDNCAGRNVHSDASVLWSNQPEAPQSKPWIGRRCTSMVLMPNMRCLAIGVSDAPPLEYLGGAVNGAQAFGAWARCLGIQTEVLTDEVNPVGSSACVRP
jgi:hypothetical protein